jgi:predicted transcriptional regulator
MDERPQLAPSDDDNPEAAAGGGREARLGWLRAAVKDGIDDIKSGRVVDLEAALERIEAMLDELEAVKRSGA